MTSNSHSSMPCLLTCWVDKLNKHPIRVVSRVAYVAFALANIVFIVVALVGGISMSHAQSQWFFVMRLCLFAYAIISLVVLFCTTTALVFYYKHGKCRPLYVVLTVVREIVVGFIVVVLIVCHWSEVSSMRIKWSNTIAAIAVAESIMLYHLFLAAVLFCIVDCPKTICSK